MLTNGSPLPIRAVMAHSAPCCCAESSFRAAIACSAASSSVMGIKKMRLGDNRVFQVVISISVPEHEPVGRSGSFVWITPSSVHGNPLQCASLRFIPLTVIFSSSCALFVGALKFKHVKCFDRPRRILTVL